MKRFATHREEPVVVVPVIGPDVQVELALRVVPIEVTDLAITVPALLRYLYKILSLPPPFEYSQG